MIKQSSVTLIFLLLTITANVYASEYDFRKVKWGASIQEVMASEKGKPVEKNKEMVIYKDKIINKNVWVAYHFAQNKLVGSMYISLDKHSNDNFFIDDYEDFKTALTKVYGKPTMDKAVWKKQNSLFKSDRDCWGMAVGIGHLCYISSWKTENSAISLLLSGDNAKIRLGISYSSKEFEHLLEKQNDEHNKNVF